MTAVFPRHPVASIEVPGKGTVSIVVEVEGQAAWVAAASHELTTSFERYSWNPSSGWRRRETDPRDNPETAWPRITSESAESVAQGLMMYLGYSVAAGIDTPELRADFVRALNEAMPLMEAAIVMDS